MTIASDGGTLTNLELATRQQLAEDLTRNVRTRIFDGTYGPGDHPRLDRLAADFGSNITPVREALLSLQAEGLSTRQPRRGQVARCVLLNGWRLTGRESDIERTGASWITWLEIWRDEQYLGDDG
jgi:DNA-binding transcriptional MocR family regulator